CRRSRRRLERRAMRGLRRRRISAGRSCFVSTSVWVEPLARFDLWRLARLEASGAAIKIFVSCQLFLSLALLLVFFFLARFSAPRGALRKSLSGGHSRLV